MGDLVEREGPAPRLEQPGLGGLHPVEERPTAQRFWGAVCPWEGLRLQQVRCGCSPESGPTLEKFTENCLPWEGPHGLTGEGLLSRSSGRQSR